MTKINHNLSILIPAWNSEKYLESGINSLLKNDYDHYKIYLIAGGSDNTFEISKILEKANQEKIKVLEQKVPNKNRALNIAIREVDGEIIVLTDIDCIFPKDWLERINEIFQNSENNVITGYHLPFESDKSSLAEYLRIQSGYKIISDPEISVNTLTGANTAFRKEIFEKKIGEFDENIKIGTDRKLGEDFTQKKENIHFIRNMYIYTEYFSNSYRYYVKRETRWLRMMLYHFKKRQVLDKRYGIGKILLTLFVGLFRILYPIMAIFTSLFFFQFNYWLLFLSPWFLYYGFFLIKHFFKLRKMSKAIFAELKLNFKHRKAYKVVPLLFFLNGIVVLKSYFGYLNPRTRTKWI